MLTLLRSLVQPRLDYCSQLWSPSDQGSINRLEAVQHNFVSRIWDPVREHLNYWERLKLLWLYSRERRRERYMVCFLWKLSRGLISSYNIQWQRSDRRGLYAVPSPLASLRNQDGSFEVFKNHMDIFLSRVPDQPTMPGLARAAATNSLLDQLQMLPN